MSRRVEIPTLPGVCGCCDEWQPRIEDDTRGMCHSVINTEARITHEEHTCEWFKEAYNPNKGKTIRTIFNTMRAAQ